MDKNESYIKELEKKLLESETKFDILYNNSPDMYVALSPKNGCVKFCNKTFLIKTGYSEDEVIGSKVFDLYDKSCLPEVEKAFIEFKTTGKVRNKHLLIKKKDGSLIDVMLNVVAVKDENGDIIYSSSSLRDISEDLKNKRKEIENEYLLLESQRMGKIGSWKYDLTSKKISCSSEVYKIFEIDKENEIKDFAQLLEKIIPEDRLKVQTTFDHFLINKEKYDIEYSLQIEDKVKHIYSTSESVFDSSNELILLIGTIQDITYTKNIQKELENFNQNLEDKIIEKTNELNLAHEQLIFSEKMASLGSLVGGVAHEINTPIGIGITGISHFDELLKDLEYKYNNEKMKEKDFEDFLLTSLDISNIIGTNLHKAANLVQSFKQVAVDQISEKKRNFLFYDYLHDILRSINTIIKKKNISIAIDCPKDLKIFTYPGIISQVFTNLLINSLTHGFKDMDIGKINISIENKGYIEIVYRDNGIGIDKENLSKVFEPFFTTNREYGGSGLGLSIIYNIVREYLNGTITCSSNKNKGVEFKIIFQP